MIGTSISHYRVLEKLGAGGMGVVYKAQDTRLGRFVALKFLPEEYADDPQLRERFQREARAASALNHPNICTVYDIGEDHGRVYMAMEFLDGKTLYERLKSGPLSPLELLDIAIPIATALQAAHTEGIIHRDIKLANVLITSSGLVKILDFGLAKQTKAAREAALTAAGEGPVEETQMTSGFAALGTAAYMSPEQALGRPLDNRTDLFSFGIVLYEMATGQAPFHGLSTGELLLSIVQEPPRPPTEINPEVPPELQAIIAKCLQKKREDRYSSAAEIRTDLRNLRQQLRGSAGTATANLAEGDSVATELEETFTGPDTKAASSSKSTHATPAPPVTPVPVAQSKSLWKRVAAISATLLVVLTAVLFYLHSRRATALTQKDRIVLADFVNTTGETIFDDTLRQAVSLDLAQSPFLSVLPDRQVAAVLQQMDRPPDQRLTQEVAREVCLRSNSTAMVVGAIKPAKAGYEVRLSAVNCASQAIIASAEAEAQDRGAVLQAIHSADGQLRRKLGESLPSLAKFNRPLAEATTSSLEALQAYTEGLSAATHVGTAAAIPHYERAIQLDPNFAQAYANLGVMQSNLSQHYLARQYLQRAYELRNRVTENERMFIEVSYYRNVTRDEDKATSVSEEWARTYPNEITPRIRIALGKMDKGQYEEAEHWLREANQINPDNSNIYVDLMVAYMALGRFDEAKVVFEEAMERKLDNEALRLNRYGLAFVEGDHAAMEEQAAFSKGKADYEDRLQSYHADCVAFFGRLAAARELSLRAIEGASRTNAMERAAEYQASIMWREAEVGNASMARSWATQATRTSNSSYVKGYVALAMARIGDNTTAEKLAAELDREAADDTVMQRNTLPTIRALVELNRGNAAKALDVLSKSPPYDMGPGPYAALEPVYVRGLAYLQAGRGPEAAAEFQKLVQYRGIVGSSITGALVHLQLARAYTLSGKKDMARTEYQNFLALWKDADPDVPVLRQAKAEYALLS